LSFAKVPERIQLLYECMQVRNGLKQELQENFGAGDVVESADAHTTTVTMADVRELVGYLQESGQLAPGTIQYSRPAL
jgi:hypothetical protein